MMDAASTSCNNSVASFRKTEGAAVFIEWDIADYRSLISTQKLGTVAESPIFQMRNAKWSLKISHLFSTLGEKLVMVYLIRHQSDPKYHSVICLVALQVNGKEICGGYKKSYIFSRNDELGYIATSEKHLLEAMSSDAVTVMCTFFREDEERMSSTSSSDIVDGETHASTNEEGIDILSSQMKDLFLNQENCDFVMKVNARDFHVHKAVMSARSPVLSAMLYHDMAEKQSNSTEIVDCNSNVFEQFLLYLYGGRVGDLSWDNVTSLYSLGDKYDLKHLRKVCVEFMEKNLCTDAFCDAITLAVKHSELTLLEYAEFFFTQNVKSILVTNNWQLLMEENPVICNELFLKCYQ